MAGLVKSAELRLFASDGDVQAKLDAVQARMEELKAENPDLVARIDTAGASAKLQVLRDELKETAAAAGETGDEMLIAGKKMDTAGGEGAKGGAKMEGAWKVTKYALLGVGGALAYGIVKAAGFQSQMERVHTQAGVAQTQIKGLGAGVLQLAGQVGQSPDSLAESLYHVASNMASMGATGTQMLSAVKVAAEGASVGGADLVDVTNALGAVIASNIPGVQNYQQAMGALNATVGAGDMTMQDLAEAMGTGFLSNAKIYGSTLNDVGAILATFGDNNIRGAHAGTQLRMSVQSIAVQAKTAGPYLQQLGLQVGELGKYQSLHGTVATIDLLVRKLRESGVAHNEWGNIITQLFGKKAGAGIAVLVDQYQRLDSKAAVLTKEAKNFGGEWGASQKTAQQQLKNLEYGSEALATSLGLKLLPAATKVMHWLSGFVNGLEKGSAGATTIAAVIGTVLAGIALKKLEEGLAGAVQGFEGLWNAGGKVIGFLGKMIGLTGEQTAATEAQTVATEEGTVAQTEADVAMDANPIGLVILAIAALVVIIVEVVKHWKDFKHWAIDAWDAIKLAAVAAWHILDGQVIHPIMQRLDQLGQSFVTLWHEVVADFDNIVSGVERYGGDIISFFERLPGDVLHALGDLGRLLWNAGVSIIEGLLGGIVQKFEDVKHFIGGIGSWIAQHKGPISYDAQLLVPHGMAIMGGLVDGLQGGMPALAAQLARTTSAITLPGGGGGGYAGGTGGGTLRLEWVNSGGADQGFLTWLSNHIRIAGGSPDILRRKVEFA